MSGLEGAAARPTEKVPTVSAVNYRTEDGVAFLEIANPPVNALAFAVREAFAASLARAAADAAIVAVVVSGASHTFPAGADINEIASGLALKPPTLRDLQARMEAFAKPLVAALQGAALGGGFELALTCHWRVADPAAKVGQPEVKLGLIPGAGGTQRFTRLAGPQAALEALTSGAPLTAARALELGLVDAIADDTLAAAAQLGRRAARERWPLRLASEAGERIAAVDPEVFAAFRRKIAARARGQLAPWRIIDAIEAACTRPKEEALRLERECFERVPRQPAAPRAHPCVLCRARGAQDPRRRCRREADADPPRGGDRRGHHGRVASP